MIDSCISSYRATLKKNEEMLDIDKISQMFKCRSSSQRNDHFFDIIVIKRKMIKLDDICKSMISSYIANILDSSILSKLRFEL